MRILMTMFGWADAGGGTILPRQIAHELARRGHDVMVLHAAVEPLPGGKPYATRAHSDGRVACLAVHNRPTPFLDDKAPARELLDPEVVRIARKVVADFAPDVVHFHNFLGLSAGIAEVAAAAGVPSCYTPYNFWALCPTLYLLLPDLAVCGGVAEDGSNCLACTKATEPGSSYTARRDRLRETLVQHIGACLPTSTSVRDAFVGNGYPAEWLRVLRLGNGRAERIWAAVGRDRAPRQPGPLRIGFVGSVIPIKGVHVLVEAAQALRGAFEVHVHGAGPAAYGDALRRLDKNGVVRWHGAFGDEEHARVLAGLDVGVVPSICLDHSPLVVDEMQAARLPVLGAHIGGIPDYVQQATGGLVPPNDPRALAAALQRWIDDPMQVAERQRRMVAPPSFGAYVDALVGHYEEARQATIAPSATAKTAATPAVAAPQPHPDRLRLNLGCGKDHLPGWVNVDKFAAARPDRVVDLETLPWPLPDDCASEVLLKHVLEHLGRDTETFLGIWRELYRICAPDATVRIVVPHPRHQDFLQDPTHVRPIVPEMFQHFSLHWNRLWAAKGLPGTPLAEYLGIDFAIASVSLRLDPHWQKWLEADPKRRDELDRILRTHNDVVQEVDVVLRAQKPFAAVRS